MCGGGPHPGDVRARRCRAGRTRLNEPRPEQTCARQPGFAAWCLLAAVVHAVILLAPLLDTRLFGPTGAASLHDDRIYFDYASRALAGAVPYRDYVVEYPPLAVPVLLVPRLATARFDVYVLLFATEMLLFDALAVYLVASYTKMHDGLARVPARLLWYTVFLAALYIVAGSRYDLAPAAVAFAGAVSWFGGRPVLGAALTAAGTLLKIFPAVVAVPAFSPERAAVACWCSGRR